MKRFVLWICFQIILLAQVWSQLDTIHWLPPMHAREDYGDHFLYLSTPESTPFTVRIEDGRGILFREVQISNSNPARVQIGTSIPTKIMLDINRLNLRIFDRGLVMTASRPFYANFRANSSDRFHAGSLTCKGRAAAGTEFRTGHLYSLFGFDRSHFIGIMATEDSTEILIDNIRNGLTLFGPRGGDPGGSVSITMNKGQTYVISTYSENNKPENDEGFLGTHITATKPIVVNNGSWKGSPITGGRDIGIDQIVPVDVIGDEYIVIRGNGPDELEQPIVVAAYDNTDVYVNCDTSAPLFQLNAGAYARIPFQYYHLQDSNMYIKTSQPVYVFQHLGGLPSPVTSGMNFIPPLSCLIPKKADNIPFFRNIGDREFSGHILVVAQAGHEVRINGTLINANRAHPLACQPDFVTYKIPSSEVSAQHASVTSTGSIQVALLGGDAYAGWAGYFSGFARKPLVSLNVGIRGVLCPDTLFAPGVYDEVNWIYNGKLDTNHRSGTWIAPPPGEYQTIGYFSNCPDVQDTSNLLFIPTPDTTYVSTGTCDPAETGIAVETYTNRGQCDSVVIRDVFLHPKSLTERFLNSCNARDTGVFTSVFENQFGCDSTVITTVSLSDSDEKTFFEWTCSPADTGTFVQNLTNIFNCDSVVTTIIRLAPKQDSVFRLSSCNPQDTGIFIQNLINEFGCDSIVTTYVELLPSQSPNIYESSCNPQDTGIFIQNLTNEFGCDSIVTTYVELLPSQSPDIYESSCNPQDTGIFIQNLTNEFGCDSIVTTYVELLPSQSPNIYESSCNPQDTGIFIQNLVNEFGCDSIVTTYVELLPSQSPNIYESSCNPQDTGIFIQNLTNEFGCDSIVTTYVELLPSQSPNIYESSCNPQDTGIFIQRLTNQYGCDSTVSTYVAFTPVDTTELPTPSICEAETFQRWNIVFDSAGFYCHTFTTVFGCDSTVCFELEIRDSSYTSQYLELCAGNTIQVGSSEYFETGTYYDIFQNGNGCDSIVKTVLTVNENPQPQILGEKIYCAGDTVILSMNKSYASHIWLPAGEESATIARVDADEVALHVWDDNNCFGKDSFSLPPPLKLDGELRVMTDYNGYEVRCHDSDDGAIRATIQGGIGPYRYLWRGQSGNNEKINISQGVYSLTVLDSVGCAWTATVRLNAPPPLQLELEGKDVRCYGEDNGAISIRNTSGGVPEYRFSWRENQMDYFTDTDIENLAAGDYTIWITDANECMDSTSITITQPELLTLKLGPDVEIDLGDSVFMDPKISRYFDIIEWQPPDFLDCTDCLYPNSRPLQSIRYTARITDENGCTASDEIVLRVRTQYNVYIPSAFSPNADDINDYFTVFASDNVEEVESLLVFSRWGELLFSKSNFPPNIESLGWDGSFRGERMQPAVFAYYARVKFIDGTTQLFKGDVTLIR